MSFPNNNNYQRYGNFTNSNNASFNGDINNISMATSYTINNIISKSNNKINPHMQIQYEPVNNNQFARTQYIPNKNPIPIMQRNQSPIAPQFGPRRTNGISSPQNGIIYNNNQWINPNLVQKVPIQNNNINSYPTIGNAPGNFIPTHKRRRTENLNINNTNYNGFIVNIKLSNANSLINYPYRDLLLRRKMEKSNQTYNANIGTIVSYYILIENQKQPVKKIDPVVLQEKIEKKIENENKNMLERQKELRNQVSDIVPTQEEKYNQIQNNPNIGNLIINNNSIMNNQNNFNRGGTMPIIKNPSVYDGNSNRNINPNNEQNNVALEKQKNEKINVVLEDMCIYGNVAKKKIKEEKKEGDTKKIIKTEDAITKKREKEDQGMFALGLISTILENNDIETVIETGENGDVNEDDYEEMAITSLQFLTNGLIGKKKYELIFDFPDERVEELLFNSQEYEKFKDMLRTKISEDYNVPKEKIIITFPQKGSFHVQVIFQSDEFNDLDLEEFKRKFREDTKYKELSKLKSVQSGLIMGGCRLSKFQLDPRGNRFYGWPVGEMRGGEPYEAPEGWIGIGLNVFDKYWNDQWLDMKNVPGEWVVAYHGVGNGLSPDKVKGIPGAIIGMGFKAGKRQAHKDCDDQFHPGQKVGEGVYCTPSIKVAEAYAGVCKIRGKEYKTVIMSRVNPQARRHCNNCPESRDYKYWVVNGTTDEIRPYRILYKRC